MEQVEPKRKIPREEWSAIVARRASGESLASIARAYNCTPPAIRYIVRQETKSEAQGEDDQMDTVSSPSDGGEHEGEAGRSPTLPLSQGPRSRAGEGSGTRSEAELRKDRFNFSLREAMTLEVSAFLVAFDAVVAQPSAEAFDQLRSATDRLLRATARIRIELERMPDSGPARLPTQGRARKKTQGDRG